MTRIEKQIQDWVEQDVSGAAGELRAILTESDEDDGEDGSEEHAQLILGVCAGDLVTRARVVDLGADFDGHTALAEVLGQRGIRLV